MDKQIYFDTNRKSWDERVAIHRRDETGFYDVQHVLDGHDKLNAIEQYCKDPNPDAVLIFVADHISIPADARRMDMQDKERYERIREEMGSYCGIVELSRVEAHYSNLRARRPVRTPRGSCPARNPATRRRTPSLCRPADECRTDRPHGRCPAAASR